MRAGKWRVFPQTPGPRPSGLCRAWFSRYRWEGMLSRECRAWRWWLNARQSTGPRFRRTRIRAMLGVKWLGGRDAYKYANLKWKCDNPRMARLLRELQRS